MQLKEYTNIVHFCKKMMQSLKFNNFKLLVEKAQFSSFHEYILRIQIGGILGYNT